MRGLDGDAKEGEEDSANGDGERGAESRAFTVVVEQLRGDFKVFGEAVLGLDARLGGLEARMTAGFQEVDRRFDAVDRRFEAVDRRFDAVDQRFDAVDRRFDAMETDLAFAAPALAAHESP